MNQKILRILEEHCSFMEQKYGNDLLLTFGPAHSVYDDYNAEHESVKWCLERVENLLDNPTISNQNSPGWFSDIENVALRVRILLDTKNLLLQLLEIPEDECYVWEEEDF